MGQGRGDVDPLCAPRNGTMILNYSGSLLLINALETDLSLLVHTSPWYIHTLIVIYLLSFKCIYKVSSTNTVHGLVDS